MVLRWRIFISIRKPNAWFPTLRMATPRRPRTRLEHASWSTGTAASVSKANPERSPTPKTLISNDFWCEFGVACFTIAKEGSSDGASKTTYVDGIARWPVRAGGPFRAWGGNFLCNGGAAGAEVPAEDVSAGSIRVGERGAGARGRGGSRKRGINPAVAADAGKGSAEEQEHRSGDARRQAISR